MPSTIRLHRVLKAPPAKVFRAFTNADALVKWMPPHGFIARVEHLDVRPGGTYRMSFTNFGTGQSHAFGGKYLEVVPGERLRYLDVFDDPNLAGQMQLTVTFTAVSVGTELQIVQEGVPDVIPPEACYLGWQESLALLAHVVEPDIPG